MHCSLCSALIGMALMRTISILLFAVTVTAYADTLCSTKPLDLAIVMDESGSVSIFNYKIALDAVITLINQLSIGISPTDSRIAFVSFDDLAVVQFGLDTYTTNADVVAAVKALNYSGGSTDIAFAMQTTIDKVFVADTYRNVQRVMIVVTDGDDNSDVGAQQQRAASSSIVVFALGVGSKVKQSELEAAAGDPSRVFSVDDFDGIADAFGDICTELATMAEEPTTTTLPQAASTPTPLHTPRPCDCDYKKTWLDIVFLIDSSVAVNSEDFTAMKNFAAAYVAAIPVEQTIGPYSRVGVVNVGSTAHVVADLTTYKSSSEASASIRNIPYLKDSSVNMLAGLKEAEIMLTSGDSRKNVQNVIVVMTSNPIDCSYQEETLAVLKSKLKLPAVKVEETNPCRLAAHLRESGNTIITIGARFDSAGDYPKIDIATPCFALNYDAYMARNFIDRLCKVNCFCKQKYVQLKDPSTCEVFGECMYLHSTALTFTKAAETCTDEQSTLSDVKSELKEKFLQELHTTNKTLVPYWIGATHTDRGYTWNTGGEISGSDYTNWAPGEPNLSNGDCVLEKYHGFITLKWYLHSCEDFFETFYFSCQKNACDTNNYCP